MSARFSRSVWHTLRVLLAIAAVVAIRFYIEWADAPSEPILDEGVYRVDHVIDGDTLRMASGARLRLQGIDTPETVKDNTPVEPWGPEASRFTRRFIDNAGHEVRLSFGKERLDQYGRQLAFVWHGDVLLNEELVRAGLARAKLGYRYSGTMKRRLAAAERQARDEARGIWSSRVPAIPNR